MASFICGTNRNALGIGGVDLETLMHEQNCAAVWEYPPDVEKQVNYLSHLKSVDVGDLIFMFASTLGVIGVGKAQGGPVGPIGLGDSSRLRGPKWLGAEWQVPVDWLCWQPEQPCDIRGNNATFYHLGDPTWTERREMLFDFFGLSGD